MKKTACVYCLILAVCVPSVFASNTDDLQNKVPGAYGKPWTLFVTPLIPPDGKKGSESFTSECFSQVAILFSSTAFEALELGPNQKPEELSREANDIILSVKPKTFLVRGGLSDTLVLWMHQSKGPVNARIVVPFFKTDTTSLVGNLAQAVFEAAVNQFMGSLRLQGGPPGMSIVLHPDLTVIPPCIVQLPAASYICRSTYPQFIDRLDTFTVRAGLVTEERVLLLPIQ